MDLGVGAWRGRLRVTMAMRWDGLGTEMWAGLDDLPFTFALQVDLPLAWFVVDVQGFHVAAPYCLNRRPALVDGMAKVLRDPSAPKTVKWYVIDGDVVGIVKAGPRMDGIWPLLAQGVAATPPGLPGEAFQAKFDECGAGSPAASMHAAGIRRLMADGAWA